jgi:hypothetical protein
MPAAPPRLQLTGVCFLSAQLFAIKGVTFHPPASTYTERAKKHLAVFYSIRSVGFDVESEHVEKWSRRRTFVSEKVEREIGKTWEKVNILNFDFRC